METLKFQANVPETIALAFAKGKEVTSQFGGDQVMFSLDDGRRMYVSPFVAQKIYDANIGAHSTFSICKREVSHGNRRSVEFEITTHNQAAGAPAKTSPAAIAAPTASSAQSSVVRATAVNPSNNAYTDAPAWVGKAVPVTGLAEYINADTTAMIEAHKRAIDVAAVAEQYAAERGLAIRYAAEDIRQIAATLFIQANGGGR